MDKLNARCNANERTVVKICGMTKCEDITVAADAGADYIGVVINVPRSPRCQTIDRARALSQFSPLPIVAVTVNQTIQQLQEIVSVVAPAVVQLHGGELPDLVQVLKQCTNCMVWKALPLPPLDCEFNELIAHQYLLQAQIYVDAGVDAILWDAPSADADMPGGGLGKSGQWEYARWLVEQLSVPCLLAGGLTPANVARAIATVRPWGVDVSSGVERSRGVKDHKLIREFIRNVRLAG